MAKQFSFAETGLVVTEPPFNPQILRKDMLELAFEYFSFGHFAFASSANFALNYFAMQNTPLKPLFSDDEHQNPNVNTFQHFKSALVIDSGFSFSHSIPILQDKKVSKAIKRLDIGGKQLTNAFKEDVSLRREFDLKDETFIANKMKERLCYIALDFQQEMKLYRETRKVKKYVLPNATSKTGYVKDESKKQDPQRESQIISVGVEMFSVPEYLFTPSDLGIAETGIAQCAVQSIFSKDKVKDGEEKQTNVAGIGMDHHAQAYETLMQNEEAKQVLLQHVILIGGNTRLPNYAQRVYQEMRKDIDIDYRLSIYQPENPVTASWKGGAMLFERLLQQAKNDGGASLNMFVTKSLFQEYGYDSIKKLLPV